MRNATYFVISLLVLTVTLEVIKLGFVLPQMEENRRLIRLTNRNIALSNKRNAEKREELRAKLTPKPAPCDLVGFEILEERK